MKRKIIDAEFEVVGAPKPDVLPRWFKALMLILAFAFLFATAVRQMAQLHPTAPAAKAGPEAPAAR